jgi:hypothetical protein
MTKRRFYPETSSHLLKIALLVPQSLHRRQPGMPHRDNADNGVAFWVYTITECVGSFELGFALSTSYRKTTEKVNVGENHSYGVAASL